MKKVYLFLIKSLLIAFCCVTFIGCEEKSLEIPFYDFSRISKYEKDSITTIMTYDSNNRLSEYNISVNGTFACRAPVRYTSSSIYCVIDDIVYDIQLSNTRGGLHN